MSQPVALGQKHRIKLQNFAQGGETVGHAEGMAVFVPFGIPGEEVEIEIIEVRKNFARGRIVNVLTPALSRLEPPCRYFYSCGGCQWQHLEYKEQLATKKRIVADTLQRIGGLPAVLVRDVIPSSLPYAYRNKVQQPVGLKGTGFFAPGTHDLVPIEECLIEPDLCNKIIRKVMDLLPKFRITPYEEDKHQGLLRHIVVRTAFKTQEVMLILVTNAREIPQGQALAREVMYHFPQLISVLQNINMERTNVVLGRETKVIEGRAFFYELVENLKFKVSAVSFFQVNTEQAWQICRTVNTYADLKGLETVADVYSGVGMIGLFLARKAKRVFGIESVVEAVGDAQTNAQINKTRNIKFVCTDAATGLKNMKKEDIHPQVVVLDPPRQGCDEETLKAILDLTPERIIYVSCDPATLARDLGFLHKHGYETSEVQPIDLFPQTSHVECVAKVAQKQLGLI